MEYCKCCKKEVINDGDFCGNCGAIKLNNEVNISQNLIKYYKYMFTNPVTFTRTSAYGDVIFTAFNAIMIILLELIIIIGTGKKLSIRIPAMEAILVTLSLGAILALFMFGMVKGIFKKDAIYMPFLNLAYSVQLIVIVIDIIGAILGVAISSYLFNFFCIFGGIVYLLLMYQGLKDIVKADINLYLATIIGGFSGTALVVIIVLKILIKNAVNSMF